MDVGYWALRPVNEELNQQIHHTLYAYPRGMMAEFGFEDGIKQVSSIILAEQGLPHGTSTVLGPTYDAMLKNMVDYQVEEVIKKLQPYYHHILDQISFTTVCDLPKAGCRMSQVHLYFLVFYLRHHINWSQLHIILINRVSKRIAHLVKHKHRNLSFETIQNDLCHIYPKLTILNYPLSTIKNQMLAYEQHQSELANNQHWNAQMATSFMQDRIINDCSPYGDHRLRTYFLRETSPAAIDALELYGVKAKVLNPYILGDCSLNDLPYVGQLPVWQERAPFEWQTTIAMIVQGFEDVRYQIFQQSFYPLLKAQIENYGAAEYLLDKNTAQSFNKAQVAFQNYIRTNLATLRGQLQQAGCHYAAKHGISAATMPSYTKFIKRYYPLLSLLNTTPQAVLERFKQRKCQTKKQKE